MRNRVTFVVILLLAAGLSRGAFAQNASDAVNITQDELGFGARALGMGGAYSAVANDYTAVYWNPAGLASVRSSEFFGELSHLVYNNTATFTNEVTDESQSFTRLRSLGLALPLPTSRGSFVLGVGYNRVKDFDRSLFFSGYNTQSNGLAFDLEDENGNVDTYLFDRDVYQTEEVTDDGGLNQWSFSGAMALSPNFDAGVTVNIWKGEDEYQLTFLQEDRDNLYNQYPADFSSYQLNQSLIAKYSAISVKLGGLFKINPGIRLGGSIGIPTTFTVNETYSQKDRLEFDDGYVDEADLGEGEFEYKVQTPFLFDGSVAFSNRSLTLAAGFRYRDWSQTRFKVADEFRLDPDYAALLEENKVIKRDYQPTLQYHLGGEVNLTGLNTVLRGGYAVLPSPLKNATNDMDKKFITLGVGFKVDRYVRLDIAYLRGKWKQESEDIYTPGGTLEDITLDKVFVGLVYRF